MGYEKIRVPKKNDRVIPMGHNAAYAVDDVHSDKRTVDLRLLGRQGPPLTSIPWGVLRYMDEEDVSQAAALIVRDTTDSR